MNGSTTMKSGNLSSVRYRTKARNAHENVKRKIDQELKIKMQARDLGRSNLPATTDRDADALQCQIAGRFESGRDSLTQMHGNSHRAALEELQQLRLRSLDIKAHTKKACVGIDRAMDRARESLVAAMVEVKDNRRGLNWFRVAHDLKHRMADYPKSLYWVVVQLFAWFCSETLLNSYLFAGASQGYFRDGILQAAVFSGVNLILGLGLGFFALRNTVHVYRWRKVAGVFGILVIAPAGLAWSLFVAHYREALQTAADPFAGKPYVNAVDRMIAAPFDIQSWEGLGLLVFGCALFFVFSAKGFSAISDRYPGYAHVDRLFRNAEQELSDLKARLKKSIKSTVDAESNVVNKTLKEESRTVEKARAVAAEANKTTREIMDSLADLSRAVSELLRDFREINTFVRTDPAPEYYSDYPTFDPTLPPAMDIMPTVDSIEETSETNRKSAAQIEKNLTELESKALESLDDYLQMIDLEADQYIYTRDQSVDDASGEDE